MSKQTLRYKLAEAANRIIVIRSKCIIASFISFFWLSSLFAQLPVIASFSPTTANAGQTVTITGSNFTGTYYVSFGGKPAQSFYVDSDNSIRAVAGVGNSGDVGVFTPAGFTFRSGFVFTGPIITSFTPTSAKKGTTVTITGSNFTNASSVTFGGAAAASFNVVSPTQIAAVVGEGKGGQIIVGTPNGIATINDFFYTGPLITYFSPASSGAGKTVGINGINFTGVISVKFGGVSVSSFTVVNSGYISAVVGNGASGNVEVTTSNGTVSLPGFTYNAAPVVTSFTPASAGATTTVTITGTNFTGATVVKFGGINAQSRGVLNATTISAIPGPLALSGAVSVTTPFGEGSKMDFTFLPAPTIINISLGQGGNGTIVTLTGTNFVNVSSVTFGGVATSFVVNSATSISATVGTGASGDIVVNTPGGTASVPGFIYIQAPTLTSITPTAAATGNSISIFGTNLSTVSAVSFGGVPALQFAANSNTQITARVASGASGVIAVTTNGGIASIAGFNYIPPPVINSFTPTSAGAGQVVTITGNFLSGATFVRFGGVEAASFTVVNNTTITAVVATTIPVNNNVTVQTSAGTATRGGYTFIPPPTITSFTPANAIAGSVITINGTNFNGTTSVSFGGINAASFIFISPTQISAVVGNGQGGSITVTASGGIASRSGFQYTGISVFTPASAPTGATVTINGNNLSGATSVSFGGIPSSSFSLVNPSSITAVVGNGGSGNIVVNTPLGNVSISGFVYISKPTISSFTPSGATSGNTVTITGTQFTGATAVSFGGMAATSFSAVNNTTITAVVGSGASGNVSVTTPGGTATKSGFSYVLPPSISTFLPVTGKSGDTILISGSNLTGATAVSFGNSPASWFAVQNANTAKAVVALGASGNVSISTPGGVATAAGFVFTGTTITSFSPSSAATGATLTIKGTNFSGASDVTIGGRQAASFTVVSATTITAIVGSGASGALMVDAPSGPASKSGFNYQTGPAIASFAPVSAGSGTTITIKGTNFTGTNSVKFGGIAATSFIINSSTKITAVVGPARSGAVEISSTRGKSSLAGFEYALNICSKGSATVYAAYTGTNYQWQVNKGDGFENLMNTINYSGTTSASLALQAIPGEWNGYEYRCVIEGKPTGSTRLNITNNWNGLINGSWENPQNWSCLILPDSTTDVRIPEKANVVVNSNVKVKSLFLDSSSVLSVNAGKKLDATGTSNSIKISKAGLDPVSYLLYGNTPGLVLIPGEKFRYVIKKSSKAIADSVPSGISFKSANTVVASVASNGTITALNEGETLITATDSKGIATMLYLTVKATGLPSLNTPLFAVFSKPFYIMNGDEGEKLPVTILNRKGIPVVVVAKILLKNSAGEQSFNTGQIIKLKEAGYTARVAVNDSLLLGEAIVFSFNMSDSKIIEVQAAQQNAEGITTNAFLTPPKGLPLVYYVLLDNRTVPQYFTRPGLTSTIIRGDVFYLTAVKLYDGVSWSGFYELTTTIEREDINVESKRGNVITAGKQLTSVGTGYENWRVNHLNYTGTWNESTVFYDFSGDWICKNDRYGHSVKMRVPAVPDFIYYAPQLVTPYKSFSIPITPGFAQALNATASYTDLTNPSNCVTGSVQIGPVDWCGCLDGEARALKPGDAAGGMILNYYNRYGSITFIDDNEFHYNSRLGTDPVVPYYGPEAVYIRKSFSFFCPIPPSILNFQPASGQQGASVNINGRSFLGATSLHFGNVPAASFTVVNDSLIIAVVGSGASGSISITSPNGTASSNGFTFIAAPPTITSFSPTSAAPGTTVTITGTNFTNTTAVSFGGIPAASFKIIDKNTIEAIVPVQGVSGTVTVKTPTGSISKSGFIFLPETGSSGYFRVTNNRGLQINYQNPTYKMKGMGLWWSVKGDSTSRFSLEFNGNQGDEKPTVGTYFIGEYTMGFSYQEDGTYYNKLPTIPQGSVTFTRVDSRCVGTFTNIKVYVLYTNYFVIINGSFDIPFSQ